MKMDESEERIIKTRNLELIDFDRINYEILNDNIYQDLTGKNDPNFIADNLIYIINSKLDDQEPVRRINLSQKERKIFIGNLADLIQKKTSYIKNLN